MRVLYRVVRHYVQVQDVDVPGHVRFDLQKIWPDGELQPLILSTFMVRSEDADLVEAQLGYGFQP